MHVRVNYYIGNILRSVVVGGMDGHNTRTFEGAPDHRMYFYFTHHHFRVAQLNWIMVDHWVMIRRH